MDITYFAETYTEYFSASRQFIQEQKRIPLFGMPDGFILSVSVVNGGCVTIEKSFGSDYIVCRLFLW